MASVQAPSSPTIGRAVTFVARVSKRSVSSPTPSFCSLPKPLVRRCHLRAKTSPGSGFSRRPSEAGSESQARDWLSLAFQSKGPPKGHLARLPTCGLSPGRINQSKQSSPPVTFTLPLLLHLQPPEESLPDPCVIVEGNPPSGTLTESTCLLASIPRQFRWETTWLLYARLFGNTC